MIALEISVNGERLYTIDADDPGFVSASITRERKPDEPRIRTSLSAMGANLPRNGAPEFLDWKDHPLEVGDEVTMRVVETDSADAPAGTRTYDAELNEKRKREYYESLKREFGD
jgi:hypothetical protein